MRLRSVLVSLTVLCLLWSGNTAQAQTWRGLRVTSELRCSPYQASDYSYPQTVELRIIESLGSIWSPYTGRTFTNRRETDIEHIVARSEAHDSGLCAATASTRRRFSTDLLNLTLASPNVNRNQKRDHDAADWLPTLNRCWFADRVVRVRQKYNLSIDRREADALERILGSCTSVALLRSGTSRSSPSSQTRQPPRSGASNVLRQYDDNGNGRITCAEARRHGIAPVRRGHPAYRYMTDRDNDGTVCE